GIHDVQEQGVHVVALVRSQVRTDLSSRREQGVAFGAMLREELLPGIRVGRAGLQNLSESLDLLLHVGGGCPSTEPQCFSMSFSMRSSWKPVTRRTRSIGTVLRSIRLALMAVRNSMAHFLRLASSD